jgi:uncharacterized membrane protein YphA (DoxX/SURF4 family)
MRILLTVARILVGILFIFSGLVKANDPLGLSYKMQEFFEVWHMYFLNDYALAFALVMNVFEIVAGVAILIGWRTKLFTWLLFLLIAFFTFLTAYAAFSGKIAACGCFGDCIPLKPMQSFWKDVILFVLILFLLINHKKIRPVVSPRAATAILIIATLLVTVLQWCVLRHLPVVDCLPYKKGNDLLEQMKTPPGATVDQYSYTFKYKKGGRVLEFPEDSLPGDLDERYEFIERGQKLVRRGNNLAAKITDFNLVTRSGNDTTTAILSYPGKYVLLFMLTKPGQANYDRIDEKFWDDLSNRAPFYIVTADPEVVKLYAAKNNVLTCDGTVIKTAARANPTYFVMQGAKVLGKYSYADADKVQEMLK